MTTLHTCLLMQACLAASLAAGICHAPPGHLHSPPPPPLPPYATQEWMQRAIKHKWRKLPTYATQEWIHYAASIVAGETVPDCELCHLWIACTIERDIERGHHPWALHPARWHGYRTPHPEHLTAVETALHPQGCLSIPICAYLGNLTDYRGWASNLAQGVPSHVVGNHHGAIVCIPPPASLPTAPSTAATATPGPRPPTSPAPARPRRAGPACE